MRDIRLTEFRRAVAEFAASEIATSLITLNRALAGRSWLVGEAFTVADLNVAGVLSPSRAEHLDLTPYPNVAAWLARCYVRPAAVATRARFG
jgi:glutathione S-transferase